MSNPSAADGCAISCLGVIMLGVGLFIFLFLFGGCVVML